MGKLIILEGLDGSGKATQAALLADTLAERGVQLRKLTFPNYESESSALVKMYLSGQFGQRPDDVNGYAASAFYAVDRYAGFQSDWGTFYKEGGLLIADRYTTSNAIHQCAKYPRDQWDDFLTWLFDFEYQKLGLPCPDRVLYLAVDPAVSQQLMSQRYAGDEEKKDIQERDTAYQARARAAAEYCAERYHWRRIECTSVQESEKQMRSMQDIHTEILAQLSDIL